MSKLLEQINTEERKTKKVGDLFNVKTGGTPSRVKSEFYLNGTVPWVKTQELVDSVIYDTDEKITQEAIKNSNAKVFPKNSIILAMYGATVGKLGILGIDASTNQACATFIPNENSDIKFLYYILLRNRQRIISEATGSAQQNLSIERIRNFEFNFPSLPTQKKIAEILSAYDSKIENNSKIIKNLEATAQTIFNEWFINFRFPGHEKTKTVESEMGEIPDGWEVKSLDDLCDISIGRTPPRQEQEWFSKNPKDVKWISIKDLGVGGIFISKTDEYLTKEAVERFNVPVIPGGTLVVSFKLTMGKVAITTEDMLSNEAIAHLKIKKNTHIFLEYLYLVMKVYNYDSLGSTSSIATAVNSKTIKNIKIIVPEREILGEFIKKVKPLFEMMNVMQNESMNLKQSRDQLLAKFI